MQFTQQVVIQTAGLDREEEEDSLEDDKEDKLEDWREEGLDGDVGTKMLNKMKTTTLFIIVIDWLPLFPILFQLESGNTCIRLLLSVQLKLRQIMWFCFKGTLSPKIIF